MLGNRNLQHAVVALGAAALGVIEVAKDAVDLVLKL
jgi:hypothetical protein